MRKWEFIDIIAGRNSEIEVLKNQIYGPYDYVCHKAKTWQQCYKGEKKEVERLNEQLKRSNNKINSLEQAQINIQNNNLDKTDLLGEKIEALQDEIKHLKGLKMFYLMSEDEQGRHTIEAEDYYENNLYTVFATEKKEVFKIKTSLITTMRTKEY